MPRKTAAQKLKNTSEAPSVTDAQASVPKARSTSKRRATKPKSNSKKASATAATATSTEASGSTSSSSASSASERPAIDVHRARTAQADRVRHLIALDAANVVRRFGAQLGAMLDLFSRHRDRDPLLLPLRSWLLSADFAQIVELEPKEQHAVSRFLEELEALRWYCRYTDDMPNTAQIRLTRFAGQLDTAARQLIEALRTPTSSSPPQE
ncbi:MAG: hypothetical protein LBM75_11480 [Myxococcales bacterium]|jgi:hypothetical protein|nr:hypothetical protein [Myxococcales bacterium]